MSDHTPFPYAEFTDPSRKRRRNKRPSASLPSPMTLLSRAQAEIEQDSDWFARTVDTLQEGLSCSRITSPDIICLGLGSPSSSRDARMQLAFLLRTCDTLGISNTRVSLYDPVFTDEDKVLFEAHKLRLITENKHGEYPADVPTVYLMPHCDLELYESLCRANWCRRRFTNLLLVANSFAEYVIQKPTHELKAKAPCLLSIAPLLVSQPLPNSSCCASAFNNVAVQFVRPEALPEESWFMEVANQLQ